MLYIVIGVLFAGYIVGGILAIRHAELLIQAFTKLEKRLFGAIIEYKRSLSEESIVPLYHVCEEVDSLYKKCHNLFKLTGKLKRVKEKDETRPGK
jgi:hypothetical protein